MSYSVGQVARLAGISVRTLHHYDEIGVLVPSGHSPAGYRRYSDDDLERLQRVLFYRELGFALEEIVTILDDPATDAMAHLRRQHELLTARIERLEDMVTAVERAMEAQKMGISLTPEERFEVFGEQDPAQYADEAKERWGDTDTYKQSMQRTSRYTKEDWLKIKSEAAELNQRLAAALAAEVAPDSEQAMDLAEEHRQQISRWYYDCGYDIHRGLAEMYLADQRFTKNYDDTMPGLARFVHDAILANADRADGR
ncbi:MAG: MerR family transcriptional regulator [Actinobacteria bacterium 13_2_20CM_2_71_6]|nr:MAG: MerR family transcriptional regulator [Actinobacteria bacterium 13_2_20CM_2_71_6]